MKKIVLCLICGLALRTVSASAAPPTDPWPTLQDQLTRDKVVPGSPLELLIRDNQELGMLRQEELKDKIPVPLWLRVWWRKAHPEMRYVAEDPQKIISASNNISASGRQGQYWSTDGGTTWSQTELPLAFGDAFHSDPTVDWTSDGTAWSTTIGINASGTTLRMQSYKSTDNGATWTFDATFSGMQTAADKQMMWVDHSATSPYADTIYVCWHNNNPQFVNRRTASGWGTPLQVSGAETTGTAIGCDVKTNASGDVFVFWPATGNRRLLIDTRLAAGPLGGPSLAPASQRSFTLDVVGYFE